ncbi:hypothetical protein ACGC1H_005985 [Rhizoctonia solani]
MGEDDRYHFHTSGGWHYFDDYHNVYSEDGTLVHDGSSELELDESAPSFHIHDVPYWFGLDGLLSADVDSTICYLHPWHSKYYFHTPNGLYYFDYRRNVYSDKGILVYSFNAESGGYLAMFYIDGVSYRFDLDVLWCQASIDTVYRVHTWQSEPNRNGHNEKYCFYASDHFYYLDDHRSLYLEDGTLMYNGSSSVLTDNFDVPNFHIDGMPYWLHKDGLLFRSIGGLVCRALAWSHPIHIKSNTITSVQHNSNNIKKVHPVRKRDIQHHLRCPICDKVCRRPVALMEHIRFHTGEKPYACPFKDCNVRFATRSNMRRHFTTHRAGCTLEEYERSRLHSTETVSVPIKSQDPEKTASNLWVFPNNGLVTRPSQSIEGEEEGAEEGEEAGTESELEGPEEVEDPQIYLTSVSDKPLDGSIQPRPTSSEIDNQKYFFHASGRFYYFDSHRRLYSEDDTLIYDGSTGFQTDGRPSLAFLIDGVPYWFNRDNLMYQNADAVHSVHVWQSGPEVIGPNMSMHEMFHHLLHHGCTNLSLQMDTRQDTAIIINGGGFGDIWLGRLNNGTQVAIKAWRASIIEQCDYKVLKRATREIYLWSRLKHENIQPLMGVIIFKGHYLGMVSRWMENGNLHGYMRKNPGFDRYRMSVQVASGLAYMHRCNAVHGDLRTANILVSSDGVARLTDFGLSTMSEAGLAFSETTNTQAGTIRWASPEQLLEGTPNSKESDVYALGMTILEIFTGTVPYYPECQKEIQVMMKLQKGIHPTRHTDHFREDGRGNQMWKLLVSCWDRTPGSRPTAEEVIASLDSIATM